MKTTNELKNVSISHGTLNPEHLLPKFLFALEEIDQKAGCRFNEELIGMGFSYSQCGVCFGPRKEWPESFDDELVDEILCEIQDALNRSAPKGFYFGAHPGDGSDFGFWEIED